MVEETMTQNKPKLKTAKPKPVNEMYMKTRPKPVYLWTVSDVQKWYRRHCGDYITYAELFLKHDITGRALLRINDNSLSRMGVTNNCDREAIWREIVKQRLKMDVMEIRDSENNIYS